MGIIIKNYAFNGVELSSAYVGVEKNLSTGSLKNMNVRVNVWASVEARVKGMKHVHEFVVPVNLSEEEAGSMSVFKYVYMKIKELFPETKDYKDFDKTKDPKIASIADDKGGNIVIKGTCQGDIKISGIESMSECTISQSGQNWQIVIKKEVFVKRIIYVSAEEKECIPSEFVHVQLKETE